MKIYVITNLINQKQYVGQTSQSLHKRWKRHCWASTVKTNMPIALAIRKYGKSNFSIRAIDVCLSQQEMDSKERWWAENLRTFSPTGYNLRAGNGRGSLSEEVCRRISQKLTGKRATDIHRKHLSESHIGLKMSDETKKKLSNFWKGKQLPALARINSVNATQKTYSLIDPNGMQIQVTNMRKHCKKYGLSPFKMSSVVHGSIAQHKGWRAAVLGEIQKGGRP